jgi:hypothetical protein
VTLVYVGASVLILFPCILLILAFISLCFGMYLLLLIKYYTLFSEYQLWWDYYISRCVISTIIIRLSPFVIQACLLALRKAFAAPSLSSSTCIFGEVGCTPELYGPPWAHKLVAEPKRLAQKHGAIQWKRAMWLKGRV